ncbi:MULTISPECIES: two-component system sensor histidine kinase NtrB [Oceanicaulis]|uniref:two-component system sensor histidine kinase NtrB n=1 Tax=Oceanicaulis TaxID=153232 RepID=UPI0012F1DFEA|nr:MULTISPECIES: ATP-binding protein [Oceanicaulis]VXC49944.1 Nitrogen specific signal transduction histidine kinase NtrB [Oceanicaulis sp. 350]
MSGAAPSLSERAAEAAPIALVLLDEAGEIVFANARAEILFGQSRKRLIGKTLEDAGPVGRASSELARRSLLENRSLYAHDLPVGVADRALRISVDVSPDETGVCVCLRPWPESGGGARSDVAANAAAGFGMMLSHELKNPMAGARGAAQLIAQSEDEESRELATLIITELDRARRIAERWSRVGDIGPPRLGRVNLHALVREAVRSARASASPEVVWLEYFDPSLPDALADRDLVSQAVLNLLINAGEAACQGGGRVKVYTRYRQPRPGGPAPDARLEIAIEDDGPGVDDALRDAIFNPFVTGKPAGEGLGLALVSRVADLLNGGVEFETRPGRTEFHFYLPVERKDG